MTKPLDRLAQAAESFAARLAHGAASRIEARLDSRHGMPALCAVEGVFARLLPAGTAKELVWLTRTPDARGDRLQLRAYGDDNALVAEESSRWPPMHSLGRRGPMPDGPRRRRETPPSFHPMATVFATAVDITLSELTLETIPA
ncbi:hypothetical protein ACO2Q0_12835 [Phenylobacterium sp. VNQ135]|uniref:hypothetical protein n=1 Tax=Phenylobacterium sp. VNQ135 TaxID=3400922 RepID=UPI003C103795